MIAALALAGAIATAPPFAPPLDVTLRYRTVDTRTVRDTGVAVITLDETLSFTRVDGTLHATIVDEAARVDAPEPARGALLLLFTSFDGVATRVRMDEAGAITGVIDGAATWRSLRASQEAMLARMDADPRLSPTERARAHRLAATLLDVAPADRDARLADGFAALLAPPLPALRRGETRGFRSTIRTPQGVMAGTGTATLVDGDAARLRYRIETRSDPQAIAAAVTALLDQGDVGASAMAAASARAAAEALRGTTYIERTDLAVDRATGLLLRVRTERLTEDAAHAVHGVSTVETTRLDP